jgi:hypothetical protein
MVPMAAFAGWREEYPFANISLLHFEDDIDVLNSNGRLKKRRNKHKFEKI